MVQLNPVNINKIRSNVVCLMNRGTISAPNRNIKSNRSLKSEKSEALSDQVIDFLFNASGNWRTFVRKHSFTYFVYINFLRGYWNSRTFLNITLGRKMKITIKNIACFLFRSKEFKIICFPVSADLRYARRELIRIYFWHRPQALETWTQRGARNMRRGMSTNCHFRLGYKGNLVCGFETACTTLVTRSLMQYISVPYHKKSITFHSYHLFWVQLIQTLTHC